MKGTIKNYRLILFLIIEIILFILSMQQSYVTGTAGNEDGDFAVGFSLQNGSNKHDLLFYSSDGEFVRKVTITHRGYITLGSFDNYLVVQESSSSNKHFYDFRGLPVDNAAYSGENLGENKDIISDNYTLKYKQDIWGIEHIYYASENNTAEIDINYGHYIMQKLLTFIFVSMILLLFFTKRTKKKKQDIQAE